MERSDTATAQENDYLLSGLWWVALESGGNLQRVIAPGFPKLVLASPGCILASHLSTEPVLFSLAKQKLRKI